MSAYPLPILLRSMRLPTIAREYDQAIHQMHLYLPAAPEAPDARAAQDQITKWELLQEMGAKP